MKRKPLSKSVAVILAVAAPFLMLTGGASLATDPGTEVGCLVGTIAYPSIQSAVDDPTCTTVTVPAGTFLEAVTIERDLTLRGAGPQRTTVDASGRNNSVFKINSSSTNRGPCDPPTVNVTVEGMTITGGTGPAADQPQRNGGGIAAAPGVRLTVNDCVVTGNSAYMNGGGISVPNGRLTVIDSVISRNTAYGNPQPGSANPNYIGGGGGLRVAGCASVLILKDSVIKDNVSHRQGGGILSNVVHTVSIPGSISPISFVTPDGVLVVTDSEIHHNTAALANGGGGIYTIHTDLTLLESKVHHNYPDDVTEGANP